MSRKPNIGIRELKENLSAVVDSAWEHPVSVHRYGSPWVWIVSHEVWSRNTRRVEFNPAGHPLAALRDHVDRALAASQPRLHAAAIRAMLRIEAPPLLRALVIQLLYGIDTEAGLHEQVSCNLLFRWFVGLSLDQEIWSPQDFGHALETGAGQRRYCRHPGAGAGRRAGRPHRAGHRHRPEPGAAACLA